VTEDVTTGVRVRMRAHEDGAACMQAADDGVFDVRLDPRATIGVEGLVGRQ